MQHFHQLQPCGISRNRSMMKKVINAGALNQKLVRFPNNKNRIVKIGHSIREQNPLLTTLERLFSKAFHKKNKSNV